MVFVFLALFQIGDSNAETFGGLDADSLHEIISEVYANNHEELAPCLDGLGVEAMQGASSSAGHLNTFSQINLQGTGSSKSNN